MVSYLLMLFMFAVCASNIMFAVCATEEPACEKGYVLGCSDKCNKTCEDYYNPPCKKCPTINCLLAECVCDPEQGYYYDNDGNCVYNDKCPKPTGSPECEKGFVLGCPSNCNRTCNEYYNPPCKECPQINCLRPKCICDPDQGYYYDNDGNCVIKEKCPKPTGSPECEKGFVLGCPSNCNRTCNEYYNPPCKECPQIKCLRPKCICDPDQGYYYDNDGNCVIKEKCPKPTGSPECEKGYVLGCPNNCNRTCNEYFNPPCKECPQIKCLRPKCICDPDQGYYYDNDGNCVIKEKCPKPTGSPECEKGFVLGCPNKCNRTCNDYYIPCKECPQIKCLRPKCICDPDQGYYYDDDGNCVYKDKCRNPKPEPECPKGQEYVCDTDCNRTCADYYSPKKVCPLMIICKKKVCKCDPKQGYYLHKTKKECVHYKKCPKPCSICKF